MNRNYLTVLSVVLVLTVASTHVFAESQRSSDVTGKLGQYDYPEPSNLKINNHEQGSFSATYDDIQPSIGIDSTYDFKNAPLLATMVGGAAAAKEEMSVGQIAELMANPFSHLWFGVIQNDTYWWNGDLLDSMNEDTKVMNTTVIQPVMSMQLTEDWKMIFRPVIPIHSFDTISGFDIPEDEPEGPIGSTWDRKNGLGDILLWSAFTNHYKPPFVWGFGPTIMMGIAVPLAVHICQRGPNQEGTSVGNVYSVNTVGAIFGAFAAGFILLPLMGLHNGVILVASLNLVAAALPLISSVPSVRRPIMRWLRPRSSLWPSWRHLRTCFGACSRNPTHRRI